MSDRSVNLTLEVQGGKAVTDFNFNTPVNNTAQAVEALD